MKTKINAKASITALASKDTPPRKPSRCGATIKKNLKNAAITARARGYNHNKTPYQNFNKHSHSEAACNTTRKKSSINGATEGIASINGLTEGIASMNTSNYKSKISLTNQSKEKGGAHNK